MSHQSASVVGNEFVDETSRLHSKSLARENRGGTRCEKLTDSELGKHWRDWSEDVDTALEFLRSQPGVTRDVIGIGGAGLQGVDNSVEAARRHPAEIKSLVLMSGETFHDGLQFLHQTSQLPGLFVFSDEGEYPPTQQK